MGLLNENNGLSFLNSHRQEKRNNLSNPNDDNPLISR